jgi:hypothetical protein
MPVRSPYAITKPPPGSQIDWAHPLARGLETAWNYTGEMSSVQVRDIVGRWGDFAFANANTPVAGRFGSRAAYAPSGTIASISSQSFSVTGTYSVLVWFKADGAPSGAYNGHPFRTVGSEIVFVWSSPVAAFRPSWAHNTTPVKFTTSLVAQRWYCSAVTYDGATVRVFLDGRIDASAAVPALPSSAGQMEVHRAGFAEPGVVDHALFWKNRVLSPADMAQLYAEPFAMLRGPR